MGRDTIQLKNAVSTISQEYLLEFTSEYGIPEDLHPELPGPEDTIVDFLEGKVGIYTRFFKFVNFCIPISQFLFDIIGYYQIHLSQLSVIGAAKRTSAPKDGMPTANSYSTADVTVLDTRRTPIQKQPEALLCLVGLSRRYFLGDDVYPTFLYDDDRDMDLFNLISAPNPTKVKTETRPHAAHEVPLLTVTVNRMIDMEDPVATATSSETPSAPAVVSQEVPSAENTKVVPEVNLKKEIATMRPPINKKRRKRDRSTVEANTPPKVLRKDRDSVHPTHDTREGKSLAAIGVGLEPPPIHPCDRVSSKGTATEIPTEGVTTTELNIQFSVGSPESGRSTSAPSIVRSPSDIYQPGWGVTNDYRLDTPEACQDMVDHTVPPGFEQEIRLLKKARAQVARPNERIQVRKEEIKRLGKEVESLKVVETEVHGLRNQTKNLETLLEAEHVSTLQAQVTGEERINAAFEEFKKYEDNKVEQRCAEMDAHLDKLSVDIDEELYPHMLTAIAGPRWVIGHNLRLAIMKCAESSEIRQAFANVVSAGLAKGMSEGLKYGIEHGKAGHDLANVEAYDSEANNKLVKALQDLKDLKYPMINQLEKLKDAPIELIMASLHLESDTGEDAPQWICDLRSSFSQLKIPIYPEVCALEDPWAVKEEVPLEDDIAANISRAEKKKKCRVVCRTHRIGSAYHVRSDGIPVLVPTVVPQGLAILLTDAGTQTQRSDDEAYPRLLKSKSLLPMYNLDWP
ncbi:hypothetical protein Tco_1141618 [Tanacetum coccineum]